MLCVARVNLSDWPEGDLRDVDPKHERIAGFLRAGYIVGVRIPRTEPAATDEPARTAAKQRPKDASDG
jgi:hypothetical protein